MIIGVTGGIGSGKSTVLQEVGRLGYPVYDCDAEAKRIIVEDSEVRRQIIRLLGEYVYHGNQYQTHEVAAQVFANPDKLRKLNSIVHPAVARDVQRWAADKEVGFVESAILCSSGLDALCDGVAMVTAPEQVRVQRVISRAAQHGDKLTAAEVLARIRAQQDECTHADIIVHNDGMRPIRELAQQLIDFAQKDNL